MRAVCPQTTAFAKGLAAILEREIEALPVRRDKPWSLLGWPGHANIGDSAIWAASRDLLTRHFGRPPSWVAGELKLPSYLSNMTSDTTIFLLGGGNFGDLWAGFHDYRLAVLRRFPYNTIVQLPQSICFLDATRQAEMAAAIAAHQGVVLFLRDQASFELAQNSFDCPQVLCPDMAQALVKDEGFAQSLRAVNSRKEVLSLVRQDKERAIKSPDHAWLAGFGEVTDWLDAPHKMSLIDRKLAKALEGGSRLSAVLASPALMAHIEGAFHLRARREVKRGLRLLCCARIVVTDRLHAHILCSMAGLQHVVYDTAFGKLCSYIETWNKVVGDDPTALVEPERDALQSTLEAER